MLAIQDLAIIIIGLGSLIMFFVLQRRLSSVHKYAVNIWIVAHCGLGIILWLAFMLDWLNGEDFFLGRRTGSLFLITGVVMLFVSDWLKKKKQIDGK